MTSVFSRLQTRVETTAPALTLMRHGCYRAQGFLLSPPSQPTPWRHCSPRAGYPWVPLITRKPLTLHAIWQGNDDSSVSCLLNFKSLDVMDSDSRTGMRSRNRRLKTPGWSPFPHPAYTGVCTTVGRKPNLGV